MQSEGAPHLLYFSRLSTQPTLQILESRWPWFRRQMDGFVERARRTAASMPPNRMHVPLKAGPSGIDEDEELGVGAGLTPRGASMFDGDADGARDPRLMPRSFNVPAPYPVGSAFVFGIRSC